MERYSKAFLIAVVALFAVALYAMLGPFWNALAWSVCLAYLLAPAQSWLTRRLHGRGGAAAGIITALVPALVVIPLLSFSLAFVDQAGQLIRQLKEQPLRFDGSLLAQLESFPVIGQVAGFLRVNLSATTAQLESWLAGGVELLLKTLAGSGGNLLVKLMGDFIDFFLILFLLFFFLRDGRGLLRRVVRLIPIDAQRSAGLLKLVGGTIHGVVYGEVLTALAQGAAVGVGFVIAGLPSAVVFGVVAAVLALLPVGGAALVWAPAVLYLFATSQPGWAIFMLFWGIGVSVADNVMRPLLISSQVPVSTLMVFVGIVGGISAFGLIGMVIGPVLLSVMLAVLRFVEETLPENS